jgi:hypothetical protein
MKNLLKKEFKLCLNPQVAIFLFLSSLAIIPSFPSLVPYIYPMSGFATIFPRGLADHDIEYTAMLPVRKGDIVKGKVAFIVLLEIASLVISVPFALIKDFLLAPMILASASSSSTGSADPMELQYQQGCLSNLATFGLALFAYGIYNLILFPWYYKNPQKVNWPQAISMLVCALFLGLFSVLQIFIPALSGSDLTGIIAQGSVFIGGLALFILMSCLAEHLGEKNFYKVDL